MLKSSTLTKKQRILNTALKLFQHTHDVRKVSLEAIAREAGVSPTTIYNKFQTRENLLAEIVKMLARENLERSRALIRSDIPFPHKLAGIMSGKMDMISTVHKELLGKMIKQDKSMATFIDQIYKEEIRPMWLELLAEGKEQGYIDPALDNNALMVYLDVMKAGFSTKEDFLRAAAGSPELLKQLTAIMFYGFLQKKIDIFNTGKA